MLAEVADGAEAVDLARRLLPDLAILDVSMPRMTGLQVAREITRRAPSVPVLTLSMDYRKRMRRGERLSSPALTAREEDVVKLIAEGCTSRQIAGQLVISPKTVDRHRSNVLAKLGMHDRTELTRYAVRAGLITG